MDNINVEFCDCGGVFVPIGNNHAKCRSCGKEIVLQMETKITTQAKKEEMIVIEDTKPDRLPTTQKVCPKCHNNVAYWWLIQTRSSDEPPTQFFRCADQKCKHTWREYK